VVEEEEQEAQGLPGAVRRNKMATKRKVKPKKTVKVLVLDTKKIVEKDFEYTGDESINRLLGSKSHATQQRRFRDTYLTVYYDPEKQSQSNGPISVFAYGSDDASTTIIGKAIVASTTDAGYIGSLQKNHIDTLSIITRNGVYWRNEEDKLYCALMASDRK
jgi:hypothetical protein